MSYHVITSILHGITNRLMGPLRSLLQKSEDLKVISNMCITKYGSIIDIYTPPLQITDILILSIGRYIGVPFIFWIVVLTSENN